MYFLRNSLNYRLIFLCFIFYSLPLLASYEEFYVFDVGQGNSQFAAYKKSGIGVLYDCGSSSSQVHPKINQLKSDEEWHTFFKRRVDKPKITEKKQLDFDDVPDDKNSQSSESISLKESSAVKTNKYIRSIIEKADINHLFLILSHPDKDHINFINDETIPDNFPVTAFLEGDWLGEGGANSKKNGLSKDVTAVLDFLKERENTWVEMPYYWNGIKTINTKINYIDIRNQWQSDSSEKFEDTYDFCKKGTIESSIAFLNLYQSLDRTLTKNHDKNKVFCDHFKTLGINFDIDNYYYGGYAMEDLKNVKISHINFPFKDVNSQSAIVEIKMPELKIQFFLTGDAHEETLELIDPYNKKEMFFKKEENFISLVMLPHHGSFENKSVNLFNLFKPDILGISAGNGGTFSHPSRKLVKELEEGLKEVQWTTKFYDLFEDFGFGNDFVYFEDVEQKNKGKKGKKLDKKMVRQSRLHKHKKVDEDNFIQIPFFCTNIHGAIKIDEEGFKSTFSSVVEDDSNEEFLVDYTRRVEDENILKALKKKKDKSDILNYNDKYYYRVNAEGNTKYFYEADSIMEEDSQDDEEN